MPGWHHRLGPPELVGDERHVPNRGAALRWIQAGSYRLPNFTLQNRRVPSLKVPHLVAHADV